METSKNVTISGVEYQVGRFKATTGSWILAQLLTKMLPSAVESHFQSVGLANGRAQISETEFENIQSHCLSVCRRYENGVPMPIFVRPDRWAVKELEYDVVAVLTLTINALVFNLQPFFSEGGLSPILSSLSDLGLISPTSRS